MPPFHFSCSLVQLLLSGHSLHSAYRFYTPCICHSSLSCITYFVFRTEYTIMYTVCRQYEVMPAARCMCFIGKAFLAFTFYERGHFQYLWLIFLCHCYYCRHWYIFLLLFLLFSCWSFLILAFVFCAFRLQRLP